MPDKKEDGASFTNIFFSLIILMNKKKRAKTYKCSIVMGSLQCSISSTTPKIGLLMHKCDMLIVSHRNEKVRNIKIFLCFLLVNEATETCERSPQRAAAEKQKPEAGRSQALTGTSRLVSLANRQLRRSQENLDKQITLMPA